MPVRSKTWGWIRYLAFFAIFVSLLAMFWAYNYESVSNLGGFQTQIHPYRNFAVLFVLVSAVFFCIFVYAGIREHSANMETIDPSDKKNANFALRSFNWTLHFPNIRASKKLVLVALTAHPHSHEATHILAAREKLGKQSSK
jgi:hypothetical protein